MSITVDQRFCGPPRSGNGGYTCGLAAAALDRSPAKVRLLAPPPLHVAMTVVEDDEGVSLVGPDGPVASARPGGTDLEPPAAVTLAEAERLTASFDVDEYRSGHLFPGCFVCGPDRAIDDGLRLFPAEVGRDDLVAWPWTPSVADAGPDGAVDPPLVWAALDCPSGLSFITVERESLVLGSMTLRIDDPPVAGDPHVVGGWVIGRDGRRRMAGSALWDADGRVRAVAETTWIALTAEQAAAFA